MLSKLPDEEMLMNHRSDDSREVRWLEGRYTNYFKIGHNALEFVLEFGQFYPGYESAQLHTRIITCPSYAKALLETLQKSIERFEGTFGTIQGE